MGEWDSIAPFVEWGGANPESFDPKFSFSIADGSVTDVKLAPGISPTKLKLIGAKVYNSAAQSILDSTTTTLTFDGSVFNQGGLWVSGNTVTAPYAGIYAVTAYQEYAANATGIRRGSVLVNASGKMEQILPNNGAGSKAQVQLTTTLLLASGDAITMQARQTSGGALDVNGGSTNNFLSVVFLGAI